MLNLLFISNSPKVQQLKKALQPVLKVIIDVVPDFDHGLKDVFEKRPSTVCIQEQISGVTGESVARHIQMLLGSGSPKFILMHDGSSKVRSIKGLFEHVIDINQSGEDLLEHFQETLKSLLGEQWDKIYVPPTKTASAPSFFSLPHESQPDADNLVNNLIQDIETTSYSLSDSATDGFYSTVDIPVVDSITRTKIDEMTDMLLAQANQKSNDVITDDRTVAVTSGQESMPLSPFETASMAAGVLPVVADAFHDVHKCHVKPVQEQSLSPWQDEAKPTAVEKADKPVSKPQPNLSTSAYGKQGVSAKKNTPLKEATIPIAPSDFIIRQDKASVEEPIPEELLMAFEKNYRSKTTSMKRTLLVLLVLILVSATGWFLVKQKPAVLTTLSKMIFPTAPPAVKPSTIAPKAKHIEQMSPQKQVPVPVVAQVLPAFIPLSGHDSSYAAKNPGWERYSGKDYEVRVFKSGLSIKAVQVLSVKGRELSDSFFKTALKQLLSSDVYQVNSKETKAGVHILRGTAAQKADILIYRKKDALRAFVISIN